MELTPMNQQNTSGHVPVLFDAVIDGLNVQPGKWYIDVTFGRGGHTRGILDKGGNVFAIDQDEEAIRFGYAKFTMEMEQGKLILAHENFDQLATVVAKYKQLEGEIFGVLADFGVSSNQLSEAARGFSFLQDAALDMRMSLSQTVTAKDLVNGLGKRELFSLLTEFAQEKHARKIVDAILKARAVKQIETTQELASLIERAVHREGKLHPATKTFMALRMLVNDELGVIERLLPAAFDLLERHGRLATISFHEGEDRIVKHFMKGMEEANRGMMLTKKPLTATNQEIVNNSRSRSAKLRVIEKV
jgi:16S rRNA (cytosine1402-N4)-methyltransferase